MIDKEHYNLTDKVIDFIRDKINSRLWEPGCPIPSTRLLAAETGASQATVVKALARLKREGLTVGLPRSRTFAGSEIPTGTVARPRVTPTWRQTRVRLEQDLLSGSLPERGRLPSVKELQARYGVCFRTMRHALDALEKDGTLVREKRGWLHPTAAADTARSSVWFITLRGFALQRSAINQEQNMVTDLLERECARRRVRLEVFEVDFHDFADVRRMMAALKKKRGVLGCIFDIWWYTTEEFRRLHFVLLDRIAAIGVPMAIIDELGNFDLPVRHCANPLLQVFRIEGRGAGGRMARFLLDLGHRKALFISPAHYFTWSKHRFQGVRERFAQAGFPDAVVPVVSTDVAVILLYVMDAAGYDDATIRAILSVDRTRRQAEDQYRAVREFRTEWPLEALDPAATAVLRRDLLALADLVHRPVSPEFFKAQVRSAVISAGAMANNIILGPLFAKALAHPDATVWICASDTVGLAALRFLASRNMSVPGRVSVTGFDNNHVLGIEHGLTSYDFNAEAFVHRLLNFIGRPPKPRGHYRHATIEIEGMVIERATVDKPTRHASIMG